MADFDGDGLHDVLQLRARGSVLYKGTAPARFAAPAAWPVAFGAGRSACLGDWDGDGCQELALVLSDGQVVALSRAPGGSDLCVKLALPAAMAGPLTVTAARGARMLGAWSVRAALADAFIGRPEPGPVTLRWQFPGGSPQEREITIEDKPLRVVLEPLKPK